MTGRLKLLHAASLSFSWGSLSGSLSRFSMHIRILAEDLLSCVMRLKFLVFIGRALSG